MWQEIGKVNWKWMPSLKINWNYLLSKVSLWSICSPSRNWKLLKMPQVHLHAFYFAFLQFLLCIKQIKNLRNMTWNIYITSMKQQSNSWLAFSLFNRSWISRWRTRSENPWLLHRKIYNMPQAKWSDYWCTVAIFYTGKLSVHFNR